MSEITSGTKSDGHARPELTPADSLPSVDESSPWPGLASFREKDQAFFRGRTRQIRELSDQITRCRASILFGASGLGKTSLLQAGVFPAMRERNYLPVSIRLSFVRGAPPLVEQAKREIVRAIRAAGGEAPEARPDDSLWMYFHRRTHEWWTPRNRPATVLITFDQFEELFTIGRGHPECGRFLEELADLIEGSRIPLALRSALEHDPDLVEQIDFDRVAYTVLLAMREDFLQELEDLRRMMPSIGLHRFRLTKMTGVDALEVVRVGRGLVAPDVEQKVIELVAGRRAPEGDLSRLEIDPALLCVLCRELNEKRKKSGAAEITADLLGGSHEEILRDFYAHALSGLGPRAQELVEERLITQNGQYRRAEVMDDVIAEGLVSKEDIDSLVDRRLLRLEERGGPRLVELAHDVLIGVVRKSRGDRRVREAEAERSAELRAELEAAQRRLTEAAEAEQRRELERRARFDRWTRSIVAVIALGAIVVAVAYGRLYKENEGLAKEAIVAAEVANRAAHASKLSEWKANAAAYELGKVNEKLGASKRRLDATLDLLNRANDLDQHSVHSIPTSTIVRFSATVSPKLNGIMDNSTIYTFDIRPSASSGKITAAYYLFWVPGLRFKIGAAPELTATIKLTYCTRNGAAVVSFEDRDPLLTRLDLCDAVLNQP